MWGWDKVGAAYYFVLNRLRRWLRNLPLRSLISAFEPKRTLAACGALMNQLRLSDRAWVQFGGAVQTARQRSNDHPNK